MSLTELHSIATLVAFAAFIGISWWAYSPKNKQRFDEDARLALDDDTIPPANSKRTKD